MTDEQRDVLLHDLDKKMDTLISSLPQYSKEIDCIQRTNILDKRINSIYTVFGTIISIPGIIFGIYKLIDIIKG